MNKIFYYFIALAVIFSVTGCATTKSVNYTKRSIPQKSNIAVIVDCPNNIKNIVMIKYLEKDYNIKAVNASDFYALKDVFDIKDFQKVAYKTSLKSLTGENDSINSLEKSYDNIYKLHVYNFEINKANILNEMQTKWDVKYLVILDLKDWEKVSWARAIDLKTYELIWVENYPTKYSDTVETVIDHFIASMMKGNE